MALKKFATIKEKSFTEVSDADTKEKLSELETFRGDHDDSIESAVIHKLMTKTDEIVDELCTI